VNFSSDKQTSSFIFCDQMWFLTKKNNLKPNLIYLIYIGNSVTLRPFQRAAAYMLSGLYAIARPSICLSEGCIIEKRLKLGL